MPLIADLSVAGEIVSVTTGALSVTVTLPNAASNYVISGQLSTPTTCWVSGESGSTVTFSFGAPADPGTTLFLIALPANLAGLNTTVLPAGTESYSVTVQNGQSVLPICYWNTQTWYTVAGNTWTYHFSAPPGIAASFSYLVVGPGQNTLINAQPIDPAAYTATISTTIGSSYLPMVAVSWNTAIGVEQDGQAVELLFTNGSPAFAATSALVVAIPLNVVVFPLPVPLTIPQQQPWIVSIITPEAWAVRMINLFPYPWLSDEARAVGGVAYALFLSIGTELNFISEQLFYAWSACRLATAINGALDLFSRDYFGNNLPRLTGESDNAFRARIAALLLQPQVTRQAIINALELAYPGIVVRAIEPWNPSDTGYFSDQTSGYAGSYWDYDSPAIPSLWGNDQARYQGYFEIQLPTPQPSLGYSLWSYDFGAAYDAQTGYFFQPVTAIQTLIGQINNLLNSIVAQGTMIFVKYINGIVAPFSIGGSYPVLSGVTSITVATPAVSGFYLFFTQLSIPVAVWPTIENPLSFTVNTQAPTQSGTILNYLGIENSTFGVGIAAINGGDITYQYHGDAVNNVVLAQPLWNTTTFYTGRSVNTINFEFGTPAPVGTQMNTYKISTAGGQAGYQSISSSAITATVNVTVNTQNIPMVIPNWDTEVGVVPDPINSQIHLTFAVPAPSGAEVMFASVNVNL